MRCIFCMQDSKDSKSIEHIIPESLGNKMNTLTPGIVCDKCNNYFAREVEKPFLEHPTIELLRFQEGIENKKGKIPPTKGVIFPDAPVEVSKTFKDGVAGKIRVPAEFYKRICSMKRGELIIRMFNDELPLPNGSALSRFIGKIAIESFAQRLLKNKLLLEEFIDADPLNSLRQHVRLGKENEWDCNVRRIYESTNYWRDRRSGEIYQITNEYDFFVTEVNDLYFIVALFGIEFAINIGGKSIDGYKKWILEHDGASPLHVGENETLHYLT